MAILGMDGFDHYGTGDEDVLESVDGYSVYTVLNVDIESANSRFSTGKYLENYWTGALRVAIGSAVTNTIYVSYAFKYSFVNQDKGEMLALVHGDTTAQLRIYVKSTGHIEARDGFIALKGTSTLTMSEDVWHWVEIKAVVSDTGSVEVRVDGTVYLNITSTDFMRTSTGDLIEYFQLGGGGNGGYNYFDDLVWQDDSGAFLGDSRIETFMPSAESGTPDWTPSTGTDNSALVDEIGSNEDTDYVSSATVDDLDLYDVGALSDDDTIHAIGVHVRARKTDTGARSIESRTKSSTNEQGGTDKALATTYETFCDVYETYNGSNAWTKTLFDAAQFGIKVTV